MQFGKLRDFRDQKIPENAHLFNDRNAAKVENLLESVDSIESQPTRVGHDSYLNLGFWFEI